MRKDRGAVTAWRRRLHFDRSARELLEELASGDGAIYRAEFSSDAGGGGTVSAADLEAAWAVAGRGAFRSSRTRMTNVNNCQRRRSSCSDLGRGPVEWSEGGGKQ